MTEGDWLTCADPQMMIAFLQGKASERKLRLFACGCCRRIWHLLNEQRSRAAVEAAEAHCDGHLDSRKMWEAGWAATAAAASAGVTATAASIVAVEGVRVASKVAWVTSRETDREAEYAAQRHQLHDIFGNPFRPAALDPAWLTPTTASIAEAAYERRRLPSGLLDNGRLAILSDALEEAGCDDADLLNHLREPGEHVRGCWVLDLLLGKS